MEKEEILKKSKKKVYTGELEKNKINKANWISIIVACTLAVAFCFAEGILRHTSGVYVILAIIASWASTFYLCQYILVKRHWGALVGGILQGLASIALIVLYIFANIYAW